MVDRVGSWQNYAALFTALIEDEDGAKVRQLRKCCGLCVYVKLSLVPPTPSSGPRRG